MVGFKVIELDGFFGNLLCILIIFFILFDMIFELKVFVVGGFKILEFKIVFKFLLSFFLIVLKISGILKFGELILFSKILGYVGDELMCKILSVEKEIVFIGNFIVVFLFVESKIFLFLKYVVM